MVALKVDRDRILLEHLEGNDPNVRVHSTDVVQPLSNHSGFGS
jgi:hypothetical protein